MYQTLSMPTEIAAPNLNCFTIELDQETERQIDAASKRIWERLQVEISGLTEKKINKGPVNKGVAIKLIKEP